MDDVPVRVTIVAGETEAELVCGLLRSADIKCGYRPTEEVDGGLEGIGAGGPQEILVAESDLEAAREVLAADSAQ